MCGIRSHFVIKPFGAQVIVIAQALRPLPSCLWDTMSKSPGPNKMSGKAKKEIQKGDAGKGDGADLGNVKSPADSARGCMSHDQGIAETFFGDLKDVMRGTVGDVGRLRNEMRGLGRSFVDRVQGIEGD